jgi:hypothetical protein
MQEMKVPEPKPLDPEVFGYFNAYIVPLREHGDTHVLEISLDGKKLYIRYQKAGYFEASEDGRRWEILSEEEDFDALEVLLQNCEVRFVSKARVAFEFIDVEAESVKILHDAEVVP